MEPQKKIKNILTNVGICSPPDGTDPRIKYRQMATAIIIILIFFATTYSFVYNALYNAVDFESLFNHSCDAINFFYIFVVTIINFLYREEIKQVFLKIQQNGDQCERRTCIFVQLNQFGVRLIPFFLLVQNDDSATYIEKADRKSHKVAKFMIDYFVLAVFVVYLLTPFVSLAINIYKDGHIERDHLADPYPMK